MTAAHGIVLALWLGFVAVWAVGATRAKRTVSRVRWRSEAAFRLLILALMVVVFRVPPLRHALIRLGSHRSGDAAVRWVGVALTALGIGLAVAARIQLGRNWGMPATLKEQPDLITGGPYRVIRHPIYTGILVALAGTALAESMLWLLPLIAASAYFIVAARREERLLLAQFPDHYPAYVRRTKMLLPWLV